jgi:IMP dehydrogenase/GMP reductase
VAILVFLKTMASYNPSSLTPSLFTEVHVLSQKSEWSCTYNKVKKSITSSEKFQKFNRKIVKIEKIDIPNTHIHDHSLF